MGSKEWIKGSGLVPTRQKLWLWITKESTNIRTREGKAGKPNSKKHGCSYFKMLPRGLIISSPD
jgi:hypothetical protein